MRCPIDLDRADAIFDAATDFTVGIEEEFAILDPRTLDLAPRFEELRDAAAARRPLPARAHHRRADRLGDRDHLGPGRGPPRRPRAPARAPPARCSRSPTRHGAALGATGTHPWADYRGQPIIDTDHYRRVAADLQYVAWRNNTFSLHVHVGVRDLDRAVRVCDRLRPVLPLLLAVSANSPFLDGRPAGLHSARTQTFTRTLPALRRARRVRRLAGLPRLRRLPVAHQLDRRVHAGLVVGAPALLLRHRRGARSATSRRTAGESDALAGLIVACVAQAARDLDEGVPYADPPAALIEENMWRAIRLGLDGRMIDLERAREYPAAEIGDRLLAWTAPRPRRARDRAGAARGQRRPAPARACSRPGPRSRRSTPTCVRETRATYSQEVPSMSSPESSRPSRPRRSSAPPARSSCATSPCRRPDPDRRLAGQPRRSPARARPGRRGRARPGPGPRRDRRRPGADAAARALPTRPRRSSRCATPSPSSSSSTPSWRAAGAPPPPAAAARAGAGGGPRRPAGRRSPGRRPAQALAAGCAARARDCRRRARYTAAASCRVAAHAPGMSVFRRTARACRRRGNQMCEEFR